MNASPSLSTTTATDKALKTQLIGEVIDIVLPPAFFDPRTAGAPHRGAAPAAADGGSSLPSGGGFEVHLIASRLPPDGVLMAC